MEDYFWPIRPVLSLPMAAPKIHYQRAGDQAYCGRETHRLSYDLEDVTCHRCLEKLDDERGPQRDDW